MQPELLKIHADMQVLQRRLDALTNTATIPANVDAAFRSRLAVPKLSLTDEVAHTVSVDESGSSTLTVAAAMDGFVKLTSTASGVSFLVPYYNP